METAESELTQLRKNSQQYSLDQLDNKNEDFLWTQEQELTYSSGNGYQK